MKSAEEIISEALNSPEAYKKMVEGEAQAWAHHQTNDRIQDERAADISAGQELGAGAGLFSFPNWVRENGKHFGHALSLACGEGRAERQLFASGIIDSCHSVDISEPSLKAAEAEAKSVGFPCTFEVADLNYLELGEGEYDLVIAQTCIHHLVRLEDVFDRLRKCLRPGGILWLFDYVGESQFQHSQKRMDIANRILAALPTGLRMNHLNGQTVEKVERRAPGTLISPFEAIRSGEILDIAFQHFDIVVGNQTNAISHLVCPVGTRKNYLRSDETRALFEMVQVMDKELINSQVLPGTSARYVLTPRQEMPIDSGTA